MNVQTRNESRSTIGLAEELREAIAGEVRFDTGSRALYATDLSIYRQVPIGVVIPRSEEDVISTVALCRNRGVPILGRGCGTSLAGQCCNVAVVIDFSKYLNRVRSIDAERKLAVVEPGVINDNLREETVKHNLTFFPDPATHSYCTIGGMIGNNSCGAHSIIAGRTSDNVHELDVLTYDGVRMRVGPTAETEIDHIIEEGGRRGDIYRRLRLLRDRYQRDIRGKYPKIPRRVSGYNLDELLPENGFNVARALVGTESTCAIVLNATMRLLDNPRFRTLLVVGYPDTFVMADHVAEIRASYNPIAIEGFTAHVVTNLERKGEKPPGIEFLPPGESWLMIEFSGASREEANDRARRAAETIRRRDHDQVGINLLADEAEQKHVWETRESGVAASRVPGIENAWPSWEDAAVAPEKLGAYLRDFAQLIEKYRYKWTLFGHYGDGCLHTRIGFDLKSAHGVKTFRSFQHEAADLVVAYGGSLSGEHGDGQARGELLGKMFGPDVLRAFAEFKRIWDPDNRMNPGKVVDPLPLDQNLRLGADYNPHKVKTKFRFPDDRGSFAMAVERCFGVGKCRNLETGTMCPSFKATREEMHSTRGRAHLLFEMMRGDAVRGGWRDPHVKEALDLCLSCKGCKNDCPVSVDIATYKAEFLSHFYKRRLRPRSAYSMGLIYIWARFLSAFPGATNILTRSWPFSPVSKAMAGVAPQRKFPRFAPETFKEWFARRGPRNRNSPAVILWPDTFNNYFHVGTAKAAVEVLEAAGYRVKVPRGRLCCGRPLYEYGMLDLARYELRHLLEVLRSDIRTGTPVVVLEPSCLSVFRDEMVNFFPDDQDATRLARQSFLFTEFLADKADYSPPALDGRALFHGHCHQKALVGIEADRKLFRRMGLQTEFPDAGCCGMAGPFGYEKEHYDVSIKVGEHALFPAVRQAPSTALIVADGFSCRQQIADGTGRVALHPAEIIQMALHHRRAIPARISRPIALAARAALPVAAAGLALLAIRGAVADADSPIMR